jgi:hypothetical protein
MAKQSVARQSWRAAGYKGRFDKSGQPTDHKQANEIVRRECEANQRRIRELNKRGR